MSETNPADFATNKRPSQGARDTSAPNGTTPYVHLPAGAGAPASIGRFTIRGLLGEGAFARVYLGFDSELEREVAIKVPKADELTPEFRESFVRENRLAAIIHHPNICPIFEVGSDGNVPYIVMRVIPMTLAGLLRRVGGALPPRTAVAVTRKLAMGLNAAHAQNIVHRDLKPANVLYDEQNREVLIADFGLARFADQASAASNGVPKGTPAYMAPEQARGLAAEVGPLSDVYALGVILYELLTGRPPFSGSVWEVMRDHCETAPELPSRRVPDLDPKLDALCLKAMAKAPADRPPSAKVFAAALADFLRGSEQTGGYTSKPPAEPGPKKKPIVALPIAEEIIDLPDDDPEATDPDPVPARTPRATPVGADRKSATKSHPGRATPISAEPPVREDRKSATKSRRALAQPPATRSERAKGGYWLTLLLVAIVVGVLLAVAAAVLLYGIATADPDETKKSATNSTETVATKPPEPATKKAESDPIETAKQPVKWQFPTPKPIDPIPKAPEPKPPEPKFEPKKTEPPHLPGGPRPKIEPKKQDPAEAELQRDWADYKRAALTTGTAQLVKARAPTRWRAWKQAADANNRVGLVLYGRCLGDGFSVPKDPAGAVSLYRKAANLGEPVAMNNLAFSYFEGDGATKDYTEAVKWFKKAADLGDALALNNLAACHAKGEGVPVNRAEAERLYRRSADLGSALAMSNLGYCYLNGEGVTKNEATALSWFQKAADAGHAGAMNEVGRCYHMAVGATRNDATAMKWFRASADAGEALGMNNVGVLYEAGEGIKIDKAEAVRWYRKSAEGGEKHGMQNLARCLENGIGVTKDTKEAAAWRDKAAKLK